MKSSSKYCSLYQVDCSVASSGKKVASTKRRVRWRYGFTNPAAVEYGASGVDCRGSEHEVTLVWSITSGKKLIIQDGNEVYYHHGRAEGKFQYSWQRDHRVFTVIAHAAPPMGKHRAEWKQFEMLIDGCSFSRLPKIYQLGPIPAPTGNLIRPASAPKPRSSGNSAHVQSPTRASSAPMPSGRNNGSHERRDDARDEYSWARSVHTIETKRQMNTTSSDVSRGSAPSIPDYISNDNISSLTSGFDDLLSQPMPLANQTSFHQFVDQPADHFNPQKPPSHGAIWSSIMDAYDTGSIRQSLNVPTSVSVTEVSVPVMTHASNLYVDTKNGRSMAGPDIDSPVDVTELDGAMQNLVNLDDISQPVLKEYSYGNENVIPNPNLSLSEMRKPNKAQAKEIMKTHNVHTQAPNHSALVVYGQSQQYNINGPPPLSFGLGTPSFR